jgi:hypothetical protein
MEKIVVTWCYGDYECSGTIVRCLRYESVEALYVEIENAIKRYIEELEKVLVAEQEWRKRYDKYFGRKLKGKEQKELEEIMAARPARPKAVDYVATFGGAEFDLSDFVYVNPDTKKREISMPEVFRLDEWFERECSEPTF